MPSTPNPLSRRYVVGVTAAPVARAMAGFALAAGLAAGTVGCSPDTPYRYTALSPAAKPVAWDGRTEREGVIRIDGTLAESTPRENLDPQPDVSSAMRVPQFTAEGSVSVAISSVLELGLRGSFASYDWATPSAVGTMPIPGSPSTWGLGPEIRLAFPLDHDKHLYLGLVGNVLDTQVPYAGWQQTGAGPNSVNAAACTPSPQCVVSGGVPYSLQKAGTEADLVYTLGILPSYAFGEHGEYGHVFGGVTATTGFKNDGFATTAQSGSSVNTFWPLWVVSAGYSGSFESLRLSGMVFRPITDSGSPVNYNLGFLFTLGVALPAWDPKRSRD